MLYMNFFWQMTDKRIKQQAIGVCYFAYWCSEHYNRPHRTSSRITFTLIHRHVSGFILCVFQRKLADTVIDNGFRFSICSMYITVQMTGHFIEELQSIHIPFFISFWKLISFFKYHLFCFGHFAQHLDYKWKLNQWNGPIDITSR